MGFIYVKIHKCSWKCAENLFPHILAYATVCTSCLVAATKYLVYQGYQVPSAWYLAPGDYPVPRTRYLVLG